MLIIITLGVTLAASVISWYNDRETGKVEAEIAELEARRARILAADVSERRGIAMTYLADFRRLVQAELASRDEVAISLAQSLEEARAIVKRRFGSTESDSFLQALREMEMALGKVEGERAYFRFLLGTIPATESSVDLEQTLPTPTTLALPEDYPCHGSLLDLGRGMPDTLHGYRLRYLDEGGDGAQGMIVAVDHDRAAASVSRTAGALLSASLDESAATLDAVVESRRPGQLELG